MNIFSCDILRETIVGRDTTGLLRASADTEPGFKINKLRIKNFQIISVQLDISEKQTAHTALPDDTDLSELSKNNLFIQFNMVDKTEEIAFCKVMDGIKTIIKNREVEDTVIDDSNQLPTEWSNFIDEKDASGTTFQFKILDFYGNADTKAPERDTDRTISGLYFKKKGQSFSEYFGSIARLERLCANRDVELNLLLYRVKDVVSDKFYWAAHQIGLTTF